jgi:hypothetical protein
MTRAIVFLALFLVLWPQGAPGQDDSAESLRAAFAHLRAGEYDQARDIVAPLAEDGVADAQHMLAVLYQNGFGAPRDMARALELFEQAALQGHADSQFALGDLAFAGKRVKRNYDHAAGWLRLAAARGHGKAKLRLGAIYAEGLGVEKNAEKAAALFEEAAYAGEAEGQFLTGLRYLTGGDGAAENPHKAARWLEAAALQGHGPAQFNLALVYDSALLGAPKPEEMLRWMQAAAETGLPAAKTALGLLTHEGRADIDGKSPADWFEEAAADGDPQGQFLFAAALSEGDGREVDKEAAIEWLERALSAPEGLDAQMRENAEALLKRLESGP